MNTRLAPFDNVKARQAVNFAIDRKALVNLFGGPVLAAAGLPGPAARLPRACRPIAPTPRIPATKWSAPDMEKAKQLVEESGTKGQKVTIIAEDTAVVQGDRRLSAERAEGARLRGRASSRSRRTSSSPTSRTPTTRCRSGSRNGTRIIRRHRTSSTCCSAAGASTEGSDSSDQHRRLLRQGRSTPR